MSWKLRWLQCSSEKVFKANFLSSKSFAKSFRLTFKMRKYDSPKSSLKAFTWTSQLISLFLEKLRSNFSQRWKLALQLFAALKPSSSKLVWENFQSLHQLLIFFENSAEIRIFEGAKRNFGGFGGGGGMMTCRIQCQLINANENLKPMSPQTNVDHQVNSKCKSEYLRIMFVFTFH